MPRLQRITGLSSLDQLIVGMLVLYLFVFAFELSLVLPCGGWENLDTCDHSSAEAARAAWQGYYEIDKFKALRTQAYYDTLSKFINIEQGTVSDLNQLWDTIL